MVLVFKDSSRPNAFLILCSFLFLSSDSTQLALDPCCFHDGQPQFYEGFFAPFTHFTVLPQITVFSISLFMFLCLIASFLLFSSFLKKTACSSFSPEVSQWYSCILNFRYSLCEIFLLSEVLISIPQLLFFRCCPNSKHALELFLPFNLF